MTLKATERDILISHNRAKAKEAIEQVEWLIENQKWHIAMNRIYYGIYYMLSAVAIQEQFETTKHQQLIGWFNKTYIKTEILDRKYGQWLNQAYENRLEGDYNVLSEFSETVVKAAFADMQEVIAAIEKFVDMEEEPHE